MITVQQYTLGEAAHDGVEAAIYRGYRNEDRQPVSIKLLKGEYPSPRQIAKLRHEYAITRDLDSAGILRPYSLEKYGSGLMLVLEHTRAEPLTSIIRSRRMDLR